MANYSGRPTGGGRGRLRLGTVQSQAVNAEGVPREGTLYYVPYEESGHVALWDGERWTTQEVATPRPEDSNGP